MMGNGYDGWMADRSWEFWIACGLMLFLIAVVIALVVVLLSGRATPPAPSRSERAERPDALRTLEQRYAAGDIDDDEFRRRRTLLGS